MEVMHFALMWPKQQPNRVDTKMRIMRAKNLDVIGADGNVAASHLLALNKHDSLTTYYLSMIAAKRQNTRTGSKRPNLVKCAARSPATFIYCTYCFLQPTKTLFIAGTYDFPKNLG